MPTRLCTALVGRKPVSPFSPDTVPGLHQWYRADDVLGADQSVIPTAPDVWLDRSGNSFHLDKLAGSSTKIFRGSGPNAQDYVLVVDRLQNPGDAGVTAPWQISPPQSTFFIIMRPKGTNTVRNHNFGVFSNTTSPYLAFGNDANKLYVETKDTSGGGAAPHGPTMTADVWQRWTFRMGADDLWEMYNGSTMVKAAAPLAGDVSADFDRSGLGFPTKSFAVAQNTDIAELIVYNRAVTDQERNDVWGYLANRYGL